MEYLLLLSGTKSIINKILVIFFKYKNVIVWKDEIVFIIREIVRGMLPSP